jgi:hypothetical protein
MSRMTLSEKLAHSEDFSPPHASFRNEEEGLEYNLTTHSYQVQLRISAYCFIP